MGKVMLQVVVVCSRWSERRVGLVKVSILLSQHGTVNSVIYKKDELILMTVDIFMD